MSFKSAPVHMPSLVLPRRTKSRLRLAQSQGAHDGSEPLDSTRSQLAARPIRLFLTLGLRSLSTLSVKPPAQLGLLCYYSSKLKGDRDESNECRCRRVRSICGNAHDCRRP